MQMTPLRCGSWGAVVFMAATLVASSAESQTRPVPEAVRTMETGPVDASRFRSITGSPPWRELVTAIHDRDEPIDSAVGLSRERPAIGATTLHVGRNILVVEDDDNSIFENGFTGQGSEETFAELTELVYAQYPDRFDFLMFFIDWSLGGGVFDIFFAFYAPISNDVEGIGLQHQPPFVETFDNSLGRLQGFIFMNDWRFYMGAQADFGRFVFLQEIGHRWGAFVHYDDGDGDRSDLLGRDEAHWSYFMNTVNSAMEGNDWQDNGDGSFTTANSQSRATYSPLDLYLMGVLPPEDVPPWYLIRNPETFGQLDDQGREINPASTPEAMGDRVTVDGERVDLTIDDILRAEGPRNPGVEDTQREWTVGTVLIVRSGDTASPELIDTIETLVDDWRILFKEATNNELELITRLDGEPSLDFVPFGETCDASDNCDQVTATTCVVTGEGASKICSKRCAADSECGDGFCCGTTGDNNFCFPAGNTFCTDEVEPDAGNPEPDTGQPDVGFADDDGAANRADGDSDGCGCTTTSSGPGLWWPLPLALLAVVAVRLRRRRAA